MPGSPTEAGELTPSPGHHQNLQEEAEKLDEDGLEIIPPQAKKDKKKHKHKRKDRRKVSSVQPDVVILPPVIDLTNNPYHSDDREGGRHPSGGAVSSGSGNPEKRDRDRRPERAADRQPVEHESRSRRDDRVYSRYDDRYSDDRYSDERIPPRNSSRTNLADYADRLGPQQPRRYSPSGREPPSRGDLRHELTSRQMGRHDDRRGIDRSRSRNNTLVLDYQVSRSADRRPGDRSRSPRPPRRVEQADSQSRRVESKERSHRDTYESGDSTRRTRDESRGERKDAGSHRSERSRKDEEELSSQTGEDKENKSEAKAKAEESEEAESGSEEESEEGTEEESGSEESGSEEEDVSVESSSEEEDEEQKTKKSSKRPEDRAKRRSEDAGDDKSPKRRKVKSKFESSESESESERQPSPQRSTGQEMAQSPEISDQEMLPDSPVLSEPPSPPIRKPLYLPALQGCRSVDDFRHLNRIEEGTYGVVFRAEDLKLKEIVALKRLKMEKEKEGFPITSLREINTLLKTQHENIVTVREIVVGSNMDKIYLVMDFVEHDLKNLMESMKNPFSIGEVKTLLCQLLKAVAHMHDNWILHRDLKTSNLLLSHKGILKVGDFGLAREYGSPLKNYTPVVVTLWYRAPELLLGTKKYSCPIDLWSVGCIFAEMLLMKPLWQGKNEIDQINKIFKDLGTPNEEIWPGVKQMPAMQKCTFTNYAYYTLNTRFADGILDKLGSDLLNKFLTYNPEQRVTAAKSLDHEYFDAHPRPIDPSMFPTWPARSEQPRGRKGQKTPRPPSGGAAYKKITEGDDVGNAGFVLNAVPSASVGFNLKF